MPAFPEITGASSPQAAHFSDQTSSEPNGPLAESLAGVSSETGRFEPMTVAAQAEPTAAAGPSGSENHQDGHEVLEPAAQSPLADDLARVSINDGSADGRAATLKPLDAVPLPRSQTLVPFAPEALKSLKANQELADSLEDAAISANEGARRVGARDAGGIDASDLSRMTDASIDAWKADNDGIDELLAELSESVDSEDLASTISSDGSNASGEPESNPALDERLSDLGKWRGILPGNAPGNDGVPGANANHPVIVAQPNTPAVATEMSCQDQFREDALKFLFAHSSKANALSADFAKEPGNPAAKITIIRFAENYLIACDAVKCSNAADKDIRLSQLHDAAKDYVALIEKHGAGKKSVFGAFYLGNKTALNSRLAVEARLCKHAGADSTEGRAALVSAALTSRVAPYIETYLSENLGGNVTGLAKGDIPKLIESQAKYALERISAVSENLIKRDGASVHNIAAMLEMLMVWPDLLRSFMDGSVLPAGAAADAADEADAADDAESEGVPDVDDDDAASASGSMPKVNPSSEQPAPPRPFGRSASNPIPATPAPGDGQSGATYVTNNYVTNDNSVTDNSVHIADSYNRSTDRPFFASGMQPDAYRVADQDQDLDLEQDDGTGSVHGSEAASENGDQHVDGQLSDEFNVNDDFEDAGNLVAIRHPKVPDADVSADGDNVNFENPENSPAEPPTQFVIEVDSSRERGEAGIDDNFSVADDPGSDEVDLGFGNQELASTDARPNSISVPIRPYVSTMPRYDSEPDLDGIVNRNREVFERSLSDYGSGAGSIQFTVPEASRSDTDLSIKTVAFARKIEEAREERRASWQLITERSTQEREEWKIKLSPRVILTVSRDDEVRRAGGWSRQASRADNSESLLPVEAGR